MPEGLLGLSPRRSDRMWTSASRNVDIGNNYRLTIFRTLPSAESPKVSMKSSGRETARNGARRTDAAGPDSPLCFVCCFVFLLGT